MVNNRTTQHKSLSGVSSKSGGGGGTSALEAQVDTLQSTVASISVDSTQVTTNENSITAHNISLPSITRI